MRVSRSLIPNRLFGASGFARPSRKRALLSAFAVALAIEASCRTVVRPQPEFVPKPSVVAPEVVTPEAAPVPPGLVPPPVIRVGLLQDVARTSIGADSGVIVSRSGKPEERVARATFLPVAAATARSIFRVQVASLADEAAAREIGARAGSASGIAARVAWNPTTRTYQVRVGELPNREEAQAVASRLQREGLQSWVVEDPVLAASGRIRLSETSEELTSAVLWAARGDEWVTVDGLAYRGFVEVRAAAGGKLTVINVLNMDDYLRGVVPNELSPTTFPEIEALKAQAIAARTYALRNRGQFAAQGYDICASPTCQVYKGKSTEHPLSDQAVEETRGLAASYHGSLINALYTSTCGGHTETGSNIFEGESTPYLVGVACAPEQSALAKIHGVAPLAAPSADGLARETALLVALEVIGPRVADNLDAAVTEQEVKTWTARLLTSLRREGCPASAERPLDERGHFLRYVASPLCWEERGRRLMGAQDTDYLLQVEDRHDFKGEPERLAAAVLMQEEVLRPFPDNTLRPRARLSRADALAMLGRAALRVGPPGLHAAEFRGVTAGGISLKDDAGLQDVAVDPGLRLVRILNGNALAVSELGLATGDKVRYIATRGRVTYLESEQSLSGAAADRTSKYYRWEVRMTPAEIAQGIARYGSVGTVKDLVPRRTGISGRVVELAVVGSDGELLLKGLKVRWGLGLKENLFVIDREQDASGAVSRFVFTGKGWGHGVGLCQVGAFGMAQSGATYDRILQHYYSGITLEKAY